jgi:UDP-glucose 4-epimerase
LKDGNFCKIMKILITGGAGFIGSHLTDQLIKAGNEVIVVDNLSTGKEDNLNPKAKFYKLDIRDSKIFNVFENEKPEMVFHYAAQIDIRKSTEDPIESANINILGTLNLLENCRKFGTKKIVFASSGGAIYGDAEIIPTPENYPPLPASPYGIEKLIAEHYLDFYKKSYGLNHLILRYANVYGPRQNSKGEAGVVAIFTDKLSKNQIPVINGDGTQTRDYVFVNDVVDAAMLALEDSKFKKPIFNIGTGVETSVNNLYELITKEVGKDISANYAPSKIGEQKRSCLDSSKIKKELNWQPKYNLEKGIKKTINYFYEKNIKKISA